MSLMIFDCDGVLVDSEVLTHRILIHQLAEYDGVHLDLDEVLKECLGLTAGQTYQKLQEKLGRKFRPGEVEKIQLAIHQALSSQVTAISGVRELLRLLPVWGVPYCLASNGSPERIEIALRASSLNEFFTPQTIFSAQMVSQPKPAPDVYLKAASSFDLEPSQCWIIEDSVVGVRAALAARMNCILFLGAQHAQREWYRERMAPYRKEVAQVCETMEEVKAFVQKSVVGQQV